MKQKTGKRIINVLIGLLLLCPILVDQTTLVSAQTGSDVTIIAPSSALLGVGEQFTDLIHIDITGVNPPANTLEKLTSTFNGVEFRSSDSAIFGAPPKLDVIYTTNDLNEAPNEPILVLSLIHI